MVQIQKTQTGLLGTNTYIVESTESAIIIDPAGNTEELIKYLEGLKPSAILLTHGHFDHIGGAEKIAEHFDIPIYIHENDEEMLYDSTKNASYTLLYRDITLGSKYVRIFGADATLHIHDMVIKAYHTPGHTKGGVSYLIENHLFSGDLIFEGSYGRYDLYGGDFGALMNSIKSLMVLPDDTLVYPGHGGCRFTLKDYFGSMGM